MKAFPQIIKVLYNKDCVSEQAIIYWHQKGSKPQGRQHFLKITEPLVKVCILEALSKNNNLNRFCSFYKNKKAVRRKISEGVLSLPGF
jgi:hypothetical protein